MKAVEQFINELEKNGIKVDHNTTGEGENKREIVHMGVSGNNFSGLHFNIVFDPEGSFSAQMFCNEICKVPEAKNLIILQTVNALNAKYRWVAFYVTADGSVTANMSFEFNDNKPEDLIASYLRHFYGIIDTAYPILMKALYA